MFYKFYLTLRNYPSEASIMVARQLKIISQIDVFTISATRNIQYVFKKLVYLIDVSQREGTPLTGHILLPSNRNKKPTNQNKLGD